MGSCAVSLTGADQPTRDGGGEVSAVIGADQVQVDVEPGTGSCRGDHVAMIDVEDAGFEDDVWMGLDEGVGVAPVRRGGAAVE